MLFHPQTREGGYATFATVYDEIISHVEQTYGDDSENVLQSLEQNATITFTEPTPTAIPVPTPANADTPITDIQKLAYDAILRMETVKYQTKMEIWLKETKSYTIAMRKLYSDILKNYCSRTMQQKVETHPDFKSADANLKIESNPLRLLAVIKELVHDQVRAQYPFASGWNALHRFTTMRQEDNESLIEYHKRFKQYRDIVKTQMGTDIFDQWTLKSKPY